MLRPALFALAVLAAGSVRAQSIDLSFLPTRAEATDFRETTRYDEAVAFLEVLATDPEAGIGLTHFGYSVEGRALPLAVVGAPAATPEAVRATGKTRVLVFANIHAGEVAGKEAALMLLRSLAAGRHAAWADSLVLLVAPIYNADGNERVRLDHRPRQNGPVGGMGQRPNAEGLDLNRDFTKARSPEARSLLGLLRDYDPHVVVDLHTTNGTYHAYHLTYAPPLHPNTPAPIDSLLRQDWLPRVTETVKRRHGWDFYYYGNLPWPGMEAPRGWYTFSHQPRFGTNYAGLRGRFAILSEAYSYASFEERVMATLYFVRAILDYAHAHAASIRAIVEAADAASVVGARLALRAEPARSAEPVEILLGAVEETRHLYTGAPVLVREDAIVPEEMYEYGHFAPTETETAPEAYLVPAHEAGVLALLDAHGVAYRPLRQRAALARLPVEGFRVDSVRVAEQPFQGIRQQTLFGAYAPAEIGGEAAYFLVPVAQPLGRLAFALLEPRSDDGVANWGLLEAPPAPGTRYPILRIAAP